MLRAPVTRKGDVFAINIPANQQDLLRAMVPQLRELIAGRDQMAWRLFPNAYADDPLHALQFEEMVGDDLVARRLAALDTLEETADRSQLSEAEMEQWMTAINDIRLVLGTRLNVTEESDWEDFESDDVESALFAAYMLFGWILESIIEALSS